MNRLEKLADALRRWADEHEGLYLRFNLVLSLAFRWYDFWVGFYWDREHRDLYVCLIPMFPLKIRLRVALAYKAWDGPGPKVPAAPYR